MLKIKHWIISAIAVTGVATFAASAQRFAPLAQANASDSVTSAFNTRPVKTYPGDLSHYSRAEQLDILSQKYRAEALSESTVIRASVLRLARRYRVPEEVALGISGHESGGWKMWQQSEQDYTSLENVNYAPTGQALSSDWGVMQINDQAHPQAFPRAREDMEYNIAFGMQLLATTHNHIRGSLNLGFGEWDRTIAAYHLGHAPTPEEMAHTRKYISRIQEVLKSAKLLRHLQYTVQPGDTLGGIAEKHYHNAQQWTPILARNQKVLPHPEALRAGQTLYIPF